MDTCTHTEKMHRYIGKGRQRLRQTETERERGKEGIREEEGREKKEYL